MKSNIVWPPMRTKLNLILMCVVSFGFNASSFSQPVDTTLHGKWVSDGGETALLISSHNVKFTSQQGNRELTLSWINSPPKNGSSPESKVSEDGEFNVCFYASTTSSKNELSAELFEAMLDLIKQNKEGQISQEELSDGITSMGDSLKIINNLSDDKFKVFTCGYYLYSSESKNYDELGSGDVASYFFYDQGHVYGWTRNYTLGVVGVSTYSSQQ